MLSFLCEVISKIGGKPECFVVLQYSMISSVLLLGGILGGIGRGAFDWLMGNNGLGKNWDKHLGWHALIGIAGSGSGTFIALMFSKYELDASRLDSLVLYTGIAIFSGLMIKSLLPSLDQRLRDEIYKMKGIVAGIDLDMNTVKSEQTYIKTLELIDDSLSDGNSDIISETIRHANKILPNFPKNRALNIKLARLYRRLAEKEKNNKHLESAVKVLNEFITSLSQKAVLNKEDYYAIATAHYNIACYLTLKYKEESEADQILRIKEIRKHLEIACQLDSSLRKDIRTDHDFESVLHYLKDLTYQL